MYDIFYISKEKDKIYALLKQRFPLLKLVTYETDKFDAYLQAKKKSTTKMFWVLDLENRFIIEDDFDFEFSVPEWDLHYVHLFNNSIEYKNIYLIPKDYTITKKEAEYGFFIRHKKIDITASKTIMYDIFYVSCYEDYLEAQQKSITPMFFAINSSSVVVNQEVFKFNVPEWDRAYVQVFKQGSDHKGVYIVPTNYHITKKETEYDFFIKNKKIDIEASIDAFEIVFISYNEPNADKNWERLSSKFPYAKRIHGVKGIHQAHIAAAKTTHTDMIWVVDGDAIVEDDFNFDIKIPKWDRNIVHVFKSRNPVNGLEYGYGGVKLLPRKPLIGVDVNSIDMTTSITKDFKSMEIVSNITEFNTDPFNTWKSAFRECVKLSSKIIDRQLDDETEKRLDIWCSIGYDKPFGEYAIIGAKLGREYGITNSKNEQALYKINDWKWLQDEFNKL